MKDGKIELDAELRLMQEKYPLAVYAVNRLVVLAPMFRIAITDMVSNYGETFFRRGQARISEIRYLYGDGDGCFDKVVMAYVKFCLEFVRRQKEFLKTGTYAVKDFDEIYESLYGNDESMEGFYLAALLFSYVFSSNYYEFYDFFENKFLVALSDSGTVIEIGCGHGLYLTQTLRSSSGWKGFGGDISKGSLNVTRKMLTHHQIDNNRYGLSIENICTKLSFADKCADAVICCEVLEHLPDPRHALSELRRIARNDAVVMISAAIRMESIDHLYVFRTHDEFLEMVQQASFKIDVCHVVPLAKGNLLNKNERQSLIEDPKIPLGCICIVSPVSSS